MTLTKAKELHLQSKPLIPNSPFCPIFQASNLINDPHINLQELENHNSFIENDDNILELELRNKGNLNEEHLLIFLTEIFNQVVCDYMFETSFQSIYSIYLSNGKAMSLQEIQEISIDFLDSLDQILNNFKYDSTSVQKCVFSHGFLMTSLINLCKEIKRIFIIEFSKKLNKYDHENYFPFVFYLEINEPESLHKYNKYRLFKKLEDMADYFDKSYNNDIERFILENPKINLFLSSFCIQKNFDCGKDREIWTDSEINKIRNYDSMEFSASSNQKYKTTRNFFFKASISLGKLAVSAYNMNWELMTKIKTSLKKIEDWSIERSAVFKHVILQKLGFYGYKMNLKRKNVRKIENDYINSMNQLYYFKGKEQIKEEEKKEDEGKLTVTKAVMNRIENLFPVKENNEFVKFQDLFKKVKIFFLFDFSFNISFKKCKSSLM